MESEKTELSLTEVKYSAVAKTRILEDIGEYIPESRKELAQIIRYQTGDKLSMPKHFPTNVIIDDPNCRRLYWAIRAVAFSYRDKSEEVKQLQQLSLIARENDYQDVLDAVSATDYDSILDTSALYSLIPEEHWQLSYSLRLLHVFDDPFRATYGISRRGAYARGITQTTEESVLPKVVAAVTEHIAKPVEFKVSMAGSRRTGIRYLYRTVRGERIKLADGFKTWDEARAYLDENRDALAQQWADMKAHPVTRTPENEPRTGPDVSFNADDILNVFGIRGLDYGKWMKAPDRVSHSTQAATALHDLSLALDVPPETIGLNNTLGLGLGSRGNGGKAAATYGSKHKVINLTKTHGPGSLAHEWWHGFDDYSGDDGFASQKGGNDKITALVDCIKTLDFYQRSRKPDRVRISQYYSKPAEFTARAFESVVKYLLDVKGMRNDYLVNIDPESPVYLTDEEVVIVTPFVMDIFKA